MLKVAFYIVIIAMLQNKIYQNFLIEIFKTFLMILFGLSVIALTVRAVSFLDLIVEMVIQSQLILLILC